MKFNYLSKIIKNQIGEGAADFYGGVLAAGLCVIGFTSQCGASTSHQKAKVVEAVIPPPLPASSDEWIFWVVGIIAVALLLVAIGAVYAVLAADIKKLTDDFTELESKNRNMSYQIEELEDRQGHNLAQFRNYKERLDNHREEIHKLRSCSPEYQQALVREKEEKDLRDAQAALLGGTANV